MARGLARRLWASLHPTTRSHGLLAQASPLVKAWITDCVAGVTLSDNRAVAVGNRTPLRSHVAHVYPILHFLERIA